MNFLSRRIPRNNLFITAGLLAFFLTGCSSDRPDPHAGGPARGHRTPPLAGQDTFFDGQITAELTVGRGPGFDRKPSGEGDDPRPERRHPGGGGGGFHMGGGGPGGGGHRPERDGPGEEGGMSGQFDRERTMAMRRSANMNPPVMIHLRFTNNGTAPAELLIADFLSPLGNFVIEPEKLTLAPGQTLEVEPMTSRLAGEIAQATVTLALRLAGHGEKKNIVLSIVPEPPAGTPPNPPAGN